MLKHLRAHRDLRDIPVIMCTKSFEVQDITRAASYNVSDYVTKPFDCAELMERIVSALEKRTVA
jgi:CheY-like chemotaxis protein